MQYSDGDGDGDGDITHHIIQIMTPTGNGFFHIAGTYGEHHYFKFFFLMVSITTRLVANDK